MLVSRIMRQPVMTVSMDTSIRAAAALMKGFDIGVLPVCDDENLVGIITDRDIVLRWVPHLTDDNPVKTIMTRHVVTCRTAHTIEQAARFMADMQIRQLVVKDEAGRIAGIVTLGDIANDASEEIAGQILGEIVEKR
ncbi:CBS domain-containing protein [Litoreibacter arenae]|uniref:CBS domain protein n=1 Tax=Litoreibacter arenae DSM 19593 TaxID=1123360 RepID=S9QE69_9RHOB|nr:CBS domain-containing protein [Litoreibacter arenae]EPX78222.1 CBS domain protein [Litoreibacter arenae DSM 19593]